MRKEDKSSDNSKQMSSTSTLFVPPHGKQVYVCITTS